MKTIKIENIEIKDYIEFYEGFRTETVLGGSYNKENKTLKLHLTNESSITEEDVRNYLENPKIKITLQRKTLHEEIEEQFKEATVLKQSNKTIEVLVKPEDKANVIAFIKSKNPDFDVEGE